MFPWYLCWFTLIRDCLGHTLCFLYLTKMVLLNMYQNHFVQFSRLGAQGLGTNGKCIRYASDSDFFPFKLTLIGTTSIAEDKKNIHSIRSNCAFTKIETVVIDVYVFNSSPFSSSFFKGAFLLLKSVVWCRRTKNACERHVLDPTSLSGLRLPESIP